MCAQTSVIKLYRGGGTDYLINRLVPQLSSYVYLFFIISGFGMCCGYYEKIKNNEITLNNFYSKRYRKILPFFSLLVLMDLAVKLILEGGIANCDIYEAFADLTLMFGFLPASNITVVGVGWTLGVIFGFYILFPFFVFLIWTRKRAWVGLILSIGLNYLCTTYFLSEGNIVRCNVLRCLCYFIAGGLIYLYRAEIENSLKKPWMGLTVSLLGFVLVFFVPISSTETIGLMVNELKTIAGFSMVMSEKPYADNLNGLDNMRLDYTNDNWAFGAEYQRNLTDGTNKFDGMSNPVLSLASNAITSDVAYISGNWSFGARAFSGAITDEEMLDADPTISSQYMPAQLGLAQGAQSDVSWQKDKFGFTTAIGLMHESDTLLGAQTGGLLNMGQGDTTYVDKEFNKINQNIDLKANIVDVNNGLNLKANINDVYNKTEIDNKLSNVAILDNVYTKQEIDKMEEGLVDFTMPYTDTYSETSQNTTYLNSHRLSPLSSYFNLYTLPIDDTDSIVGFICVLFKITGTIKFTGENVLSILGKNGDAGLTRLQLVDNDDNTYPLNFGIQRIFPFTDTANELILKVDTVLMTPLKNNENLRIYYYYSSSDPDGTYRFNYEINLEFKDYTFCRRP